MSDQYASDTDKIDLYTKPLDNWTRWIKENAPSEWDVVWEAYEDNQWKFLDAELGAVNGAPRYTHDNFPTVEQRARAYYAAFFEAVALLPDDAAAFTVYFGASSPPPEERPTAPDEAAAFEAAFERSIQDSIRQYDPEEGLRRLIVSNQERIERIKRSQERRQGAPPPPD